MTSLTWKWIIVVVKTLSTAFFLAALGFVLKLYWLAFSFGWGLV